VITIYGSHAPTEQTIIFDSDPDTDIENNIFYIPNSENYTFGDGTVPATSALLPALKWAFEFENPEDPNIPTGTIPQPVKIVEWCSLMNNGSSVYDTFSADLGNNFTQNSYIGLPCTCQPVAGQVTTGLDCVHATIMNDQYFLYFLADLVKSNETSNQAVALGLNMSSTAMQDMAAACPGLTYNRFTQNVTAILEEFMY